MRLEEKRERVVIHNHRRAEIPAQPADVLHVVPDGRLHARLPVQSVVNRVTGGVDGVQKGPRVPFHARREHANLGERRELRQKLPHAGPLDHGAHGFAEVDDTRRSIDPIRESIRANRPRPVTASGRARLARRRRGDQRDGFTRGDRVGTAEGPEGLRVARVFVQGEARRFRDSLRRRQLGRDAPVCLVVVRADESLV